MDVKKIFKKEPTVKQLLDEELKDRLIALKYTGVGTPEEETAVKSIDTLYRLDMDDRQNRSEARTKRLDIIVKSAVTVGITAAELYVFRTNWKEGMKFEETGVFVSKMFAEGRKFFKSKR